MELLSVCAVFLLVNGLVLYLALFGFKGNDSENTLEKFSVDKTVSKICFKEKRLAYQLKSQKQKLRRQLETLEYVSNLESYLNGSRTPANKSAQITELNTLKFVTQKKVLNSAREIIAMKDGVKIAG